MAKEQINLAELSDDEIQQLDFSAIAEEPNEENASDPGVPDEDQSTIDETGEDNEEEETGGAVSSDDSDEDSDEGVDSTSAEEDEEGGNDEPPNVEAESRTDPHQGEETDSDEAEGESDSSPDTDYKAELDKVLAPLKAAKRTISIDDVDKARRLMQMGADYSRKMEAMKPYQRVLKTLTKADLLDEGKLNFLIDLANKKPEAIQKLLKDSEIDPMDLDLEDSGDYQPTDHMIGDAELAIEAVIDDIRDSEAFDQTISVVSKWDNASKRQLQDNPQALGFLNSHIEAGIYDMIMDRLESDKIFGKHRGLSDLEAYKAVGDAMYEEGAFAQQDSAPNPNTPPSTGTTTQGQRQSGSKESVKARKRAASPPKGGTASPGKKMPNFLEMSDEEIEKFDINSLM